MAILKYRDNEGFKSLYTDAIKNRLRKDLNLADLENVQEARQNLELTGDNNHTHYHDDRYLPKIETEANERKAADNEIKNLLNNKVTEITNATNNNINNLKQTLDDKIDDAIAQEIVDRNNAILKETNERKQEDAKLQNAINGLTSSLNQEITDRTNADNALRNNLNQEISDRKDADKVAENDRNSIRDALNKEIADRQNADTVATNDRNNIRDKLEQEIIDRQNANNNLQSQITDTKNQIPQIINTVTNQNVSGSTHATGTIVVEPYRYGTKYTMSTNKGVPAGTYSLSDLFNRLVQISHSHGISGQAINCACNCRCNCSSSH